MLKDISTFYNVEYQRVWQGIGRGAGVVATVIQWGRLKMFFDKKRFFIFMKI